MNFTTFPLKICFSPQILNQYFLKSLNYKDPTSKKVVLLIFLTEIFLVNKIFASVGELLKRRRKLETFEVINALIEPTDQEEDPELEKMMDERHIENEKRIDDFLEKYFFQND